MKQAIHRNIRILAAIAVTALVAAACGKDSAVEGTKSVASITVTPNATMGVNSTQQMTAVGLDEDGKVVTITPVWSVGASGGTINATGMFTSGATAGVFSNTVVATVGSITGRASITVTAPALASIAITPGNASVGIRTNQNFTAVGTDAAGNVVAITPTWTVVAGGGSISSTGAFTSGPTAGVFTNTVRASSGGVSALATVTVTAGSPVTLKITPLNASFAVNSTQQFSAIGTDAFGNTAAVSPVWAVVGGGGTINANGLFTAGTVTGVFGNAVQATFGGLTAVTSITLTGGAVTSIIVTPNNVTLSKNSLAQFSAQGKDAFGNSFKINPIWSVVNGGGSIDSIAGVFTSSSVLGTFLNTVKATSGTVSATATVSVAVQAALVGAALGNAGPNGVMAGTSVTCSTGGHINADVSVSPGNTLIGFGPCVISGVQHLGDGVALNAQNDLTTAYNSLAGLPCVASNFISGNLGGTTLAAGVYCAASSIGVTGTLTLNGGGDPNAVFVFQAGSSLVTAGNIVLINGAQAKNVYWQVGSSATLGIGSQWQGNILALTSITLIDNANLIGRALARNGLVALGANNTITLP